MLNKFYKYFFYLFITIIITASLLVTFNSNIRSNLLGTLVSGYKVYMLASIQSDLKRDKTNVKNVKKKLLKFINHNNLLANGKSKILIGIYDATRLAQSKLNKYEYIKLEEVFRKLTEIDPNLYEANLWYAKSLYYKKEYQKSLKIIDKSLNISPANHDFYRLGIILAKEINNNDLAKKYCEQYYTNQFGGKESRYKSTFFNGFDLNNFAISFNNLEAQNVTKEKKYIHSGISLNKYAKYEIIPSKPTDANGLSIFLSLMKGLGVEIKKVDIYSEKTINTQEDKDLFIASNNSFSLNKNNKKIIIMTSEDDEIINLTFSKKYLNIDKIVIQMKIFKLDLNNASCDSL